MKDSLNHILGCLGFFLAFGSDAQTVPDNKIVTSGGAYHASTQLYQTGNINLISGLRSGEHSFIVPSDSTSHSVLISDLLADRSGYQSPIIGTGAWADKGTNIQARSLLYFDIKQFAAELKVSDIVRADLVLIPVNVYDKTEPAADPRISVRRVIAPWTDTSTTWNNQPEVSLSDEVAYTLSPLKKTNYYKVNVTRIVKNMLRYGNFGFQINYSPKNESIEPFSRWFASTKNEEAELRPFLVITIYAPLNYYLVPSYTPDFPTTFNEAVGNMPVNNLPRNNFVGGQPMPAAPSTPPVVVDTPPPPKKDN